MSTTIKINKSTVMREANALVKTAKMSRSDAVRQGYKIARIYATFAIGAVCTFTFLKADGSLREARAIKASAGEYLVKGTGRETPKANILFCDVERGGEFRSCVKARIVEVK